MSCARRSSRQGGNGLEILHCTASGTSGGSVRSWMDDPHGVNRESQHQQRTTARGRLPLARRTQGVPVSVRRHDLSACWCASDKPCDAGDDAPFVQHRCALELDERDGGEDGIGG